MCQLQGGTSLMCLGTGSDHPGQPPLLMLPVTQLTAYLTPQNLTTAEPEQPIRAVLLTRLWGCSLHPIPNQCVQIKAGEHTPDGVLFAWGLFFAHG